MKNSKNEADLHLPTAVLILGIFLSIVAAALLICAAVFMNIWLAVASVPVILLSVAAFLCWNNQKIFIVDDDTFEYYTMFGNKKVFRFSEITGIKQNPDSLTLMLGENKVHIESMAVMSDRLVKLINIELAKNTTRE